MNLKPSALPLYSTVGAVFTILGFFGWAITLLATATKSSAKFVFTQFINNSGYSNNGWVFILSFYSPLYGLYGTDSMMHLVEEMKNAAQDAPVNLSTPWTSNSLTLRREPWFGPWSFLALLLSSLTSSCCSAVAITLSM
jgi:hypothetical protein